jgi:putative ABC transport system ATP-binding protein
MLQTRELRLVYGTEPALRGIDLTFVRGQSVAVVGSSGSGKSSLLYCLSGLERPTSGQVLFQGQDIAAKSPDERSQLRLRSFGFVFQSADLVPELTLRENIALPLELAGVRRRKTRSRVSELIATLGLDECADRRIAQVSGGQAQRAAVARAVVGSPAVVFADEPTGALDSHNRKAVLQLLLEQVTVVGALLIMVTHDGSVAELVDRVITLRDGQVHGDERGGAGDKHRPAISAELQ